MEDFADVVTAAAHPQEPFACAQSQRIGQVEEPRLDRRIAPDRARQSKQGLHRLPFRKAARA